MNPASLPAATAGAPYNQSVSATGGNGTYTFSVSAGTLPAGLTLNAATGAITGTPTTAATSSFTITATDGNGATGSRAYTFTVNAAVTVNPATLPAGTVGAAYSQTVSAAGGNGSYTYQRVGRCTAGGPVAERKHRRDQRNADRSGHECVHDPGDGWQRCHRIAGLFRHGQRRHRGQPGCAAERCGRRRVFAGCIRNRRLRRLHIQRQLGKPARRP